jgi:hypothetical protein
MGHDFDVWLGIRNWKVEAMERQLWREEEEEEEGDTGDTSLA